MWILKVRMALFFSLLRGLMVYSQQWYTAVYTCVKLISFPHTDSSPKHYSRTHQRGMRWLLEIFPLLYDFFQIRGSCQDCGSTILAQNRMVGWLSKVLLLPLFIIFRIQIIKSTNCFLTYTYFIPPTGHKGHELLNIVHTLPDSVYLALWTTEIGFEVR